MGAVVIQAVGVDDRKGVGQSCLGHVMVHHNHVDPRFARSTERLKGAHPTIHGDDHLGATGSETQHGGAIGPITFLDTVWDIGFDSGSQRPEETREQCRGCCAVDVVITENRNALASLDGIGDSLGGKLHILEVRRIGKLNLEHGIEEQFRILRPDTPGREGAAEQLRQPQPLRQCQGLTVVVEARPPVEAAERAFHD